MTIWLTTHEWCYHNYGWRIWNHGKMNRSLEVFHLHGKVRTQDLITMPSKFLRRKQRDTVRHGVGRGKHL